MVGFSAAYFAGALHQLGYINAIDSVIIYQPLSNSSIYYNSLRNLNQEIGVDLKNGYTLTAQSKFKDLISYQNVRFLIKTDQIV